MTKEGNMRKSQENEETGPKLNNKTQSTLTKVSSFEETNFPETGEILFREFSHYLDFLRKRNLFQEQFKVNSSTFRIHFFACSQQILKHILSLYLGSLIKRAKKGKCF